ncbi:glycosyltransferase family 2 protein [Shewanella putrefaciens]|uniref:glycosyltransferase family 2 protein n=1 Tax=Shewanella putrefaciens TaxID=24 RepID=UPI00285A13BD|nr:glycosyltransferase [Shewanella putrefaciens]MDR6965344.1 putative LPLAT superfamily acyltransferase/glycosyltransferase involved in cell wall biosynthesis [Shewanella putrefaciens]
MLTPPSDLVESVPIKLALVIPNYNHSAAIAQTLAELARFNLPCYLIDDGSNDETRYLLQSLAQTYPWVTLLLHPYNRGKGAAVITGLRRAYRDGFSHALQVDADGQHNLADIPAIVARAQAKPDALISGKPEYDESVPKGRLYGRYITHFWVWVETLSFDIQDSMCGFRVYPLAATERLLRQQSLTERMDFDIEILVKLYWQGVEILFQPTKVIYPEGGVSHFQAVADNVRITKLHTKLFFGMLKRLPWLLKRKQSLPNTRISDESSKPQTTSATHWSGMKERGSYWGIKLLAESYRIGGHWLCRAIMYPVICYFFLTGKVTREASLDFLRRVQMLEPQHPKLNQPVDWRDSLNHFLAFGNAALDRIDAWCDRIQLSQVDFPDRQVLADQLESGKGAVLLVSHLGNLELCRAISIHQRKVKVNVMVLTSHAENFNKVLKQLNPDSTLNLIQVTELNPATSMLLQQKIEAGELVVIAGDRTSPNTQGRVIYAPFMGQDAAFPQGPFILAGLLDCPVFLMFCLREQGRYRVYLEHFAETLKGPRAGRMDRLQQAVNRYSERLEYFARREPLQWFNFFDFWRKDSELERVSANSVQADAVTAESTSPQIPEQDHKTDRTSHS